MAQILAQVALTATDTALLLVSRAAGAGVAGRQIAVSLDAGNAWTGSAVVKVNTAPPGQAVSLSNVAYINAATGVTISAGTPITAVGGYIVPDTQNGYDLYLAYTHTSGSAVVVVLTEDAGAGDSTDIGDATANSLTVTNNETVGGTLGVTGATTLGSTLAVTGVSTFSSRVAVTGAAVAAVATTPGTAAGSSTVTGAVGGATTIATTGVGGKGGGIALTTGAGGTAALAATAGTGGAGGDYAVTTGAGAASAVTGSGTGTGGKGGAIALTTGVGGAVSTSTGANVGGASGAITLTTAAGGAAADGSANTGGASGAITIATGDGGTGATAAGVSGGVTIQTGASTATVGSVLVKPGGVTSLTVSDAAVNVASGIALQTNGTRVGYDVTAYGAGTAYALTDTAAAIDFGTTDPAIVVDAAGTYLIMGQVNLAYNGATVAAETATIKVRRTNNTAADISAVVVLDLPAATTLTHTYGVFVIPPFVYTTANTDDAVTLFGNVSAALGAGTIDATAIGTSLVAIRLY